MDPSLHVEDPEHQQPSSMPSSTFQEMIDPGQVERSSELEIDSDMEPDFEASNAKGNVLESWFSSVDESTRFSLRITACATLASLFVLVPAPEEQWPEGPWIYITAIIVGWQSSPDMASVSKKVIERLMGTVLGAAMALALGGLSLLFPHGSLEQRMFLLGCVVTCTFVWAQLASRSGNKSHYSVILGCVTFGLILLVFCDTDEDIDPWRIGVYRMINICLGSVLGGGVSLCVFPVSTKTLIERKVTELIRETGLTSRAVLSDAAPTKQPLPKLQLLARRQEDDESHMQYIKCLEGWRNTRQLFALLPYDPLYKRWSKDKQALFCETWRLRLGRMLRIQVNLVMLDGLNRSRFHNVQDDELLDRIGRRLQTLLHPIPSGSSPSRRKVEAVSHEVAAQNLVDEDLPIIRERQRLLQHRLTKTAASPGASAQSDLDGILPNGEVGAGNDDHLAEWALEGKELSVALTVFDETESTPSFFAPTQSSLFFFQLLEFLIIRSLRLDRYCRQSNDELDRSGMMARGMVRAGSMENLRSKPINEADSDDDDSIRAL